MQRTHDIAQLLVSCWILSGEDPVIPTSHGLLDRALKATIDDDAFPGWVREDLHFVESRVGLECVELLAILDSAQRAELTAVPNPSYESTQVKVSKRVAGELIKRLGVGEEEARTWGRGLRDSVAEAKSQLEAFGFASAEE